MNGIVLGYSVTYRRENLVGGNFILLYILVNSYLSQSTEYSQCTVKIEEGGGGVVNKKTHSEGRPLYALFSLAKIMFYAS